MDSSEVRGLILVPKLFSKGRRYRRQFNFVNLFKMVASEFDFEIRFNDDISDYRDFNIVVVFFWPMRKLPRLYREISNAPNDVKVISMPTHLESFGSKDCKDDFRFIFDRADIIASTRYTRFFEFYPEYKDKYVYFPQFFAPYDRFANVSIDKVTYKCLLTGSISDRYPLRKKLLFNKNVVCAKGIWGDDYAKLLGSYFCGVATAGADFVGKPVVKKYFEIPAAGSLLIGERVKDLDVLGFEPDRHYVPISCNDADKVINNVLDDPYTYEGIRKCGKEFVLKEHSVFNRLTLFKQIVKEL